MILVTSFVVDKCAIRPSAQKLLSLVGSSYLHWKNLFIWRNSVIDMRFLWRKHGKSNYQNGKYGDCMESNTFYGDFMVRLVWSFLGFSWRKHGK